MLLYTKTFGQVLDIRAYEDEAKTQPINLTEYKVYVASSLGGISMTHPVTVDPEDSTRGYMRIPEGLLESPGTLHLQLVLEAEGTRMMGDIVEIPVERHVKVEGEGQM